MNGAPAPTGRHHPRCAGVLPVQGRGRAGHLRRQGQVPAVRACPTTSRPGPARPRTAQMVAAAASVEWIQVRNEVEALMLEYSLIKQHRPRFNVRLATTRATPSWRSRSASEWPRAMVRRGTKDKGDPLLRPLRPRLRHPRDARPPAAHLPAAHLLATTSSTATSGSAGPACCTTSRSARGPASARSTRSATRISWPSCATSSRATPTPIVSGSRPRCARPPTRLEFERAARLRDRLVAVRKAIERQQMVTEKHRGPRRDRAGRRRARGRGAGVLRPPGPRRRAQGLHRRQGRGPLPGAAGRSSRSKRLYAEDAGCGAAPARCSCRPARRPTTRRRCRTGPVAAARGARVHRPRCRSGAKAHACRRRSRATRRGVHPPPAGGRPTTTAGPGPSTRCRTPWTSPRRRCASSATT